MKAFLVLLAIACSGSIVRADAVADAAKHHYEQGQALYSGGHYLEARAEFMAGFDLSHKPAFVFNAAECSRIAGDLAAAHDDYARYLRLDPNGGLAALAKQRLAELSGGTPPKPPEPAAPIEPRPAPPVAPARVPPPGPVIPSPAVAAQSAPSTVTPTPVVVVDESPPLWRRKSLWIGVGVALVAGSIAIYATRHHDSTCTPPSCVMVQ